MKSIFTLFSLVIFLFANAQDGVLDATFGNGGKVSTNLGVSKPVDATNRQRTIILPSGQILQTFTVSNGIDNDFGLARYNSDGNLDATFGNSSSGYIITDFGGDDYATSMALQSDGKIVVAGYKTVAGNAVFALARFNTDGTLDNTTFGSGTGKVTTVVGSDDAAYTIAIQTDGKIVLGGFAFVTSRYLFALARYNSNGTLDIASFGTGGKVTTAFGTMVDRINALAIQADGKIVAAGSSLNGSDADFAIARYNTSGTLDASFGGGTGKVTTSIGTSDEEALSITLQTNGRIIAGGYSNNGIDNDFALVRYSTNGALDVSFGGTGKVITDFGENEIAYSVSLQVNASIIVLGSANNGTDNDFAIARVDPSGALDINFGGNNNGKNIIDFGADDLGYSVTYMSNYIMAGGITGSSLALAKLTNSSVVVPVVITSFTANKQGNSTLLSWQTATEENTSVFEILRSSDGNNFTKIGEVKAAGNYANQRSYSFIDAQPLPSINYYLLKEVDINGKEWFSKIVSIKFNTIISIQAYPNPASAVLNVQVNSSAGAIKIQVLDISGRINKTMELQSNGSTLATSLDMSNLKPGVYFIKVNSESIKIIKQ